MSRYFFGMLALILLEFCSGLGSTVDEDWGAGVEGVESPGELWAGLKRNYMDMRSSYQGARGWSYEHGSDQEKRANVKKWWWLLSSDTKPKQQQKWKKGSTSMVCYFKVCAVPAPV